MVNYTVDTEVVAVFRRIRLCINYITVLICGCSQVPTSGCTFQVQRNLTHTVDGVVGIVCHFRHTVLSTSHDHTATKDTAEVGTLDCVQNTTCITGNDTVLCPI